MKKSGLLLIIITSFTALASPVLPMNKAFNALVELIPFITEQEEFLDKKNNEIIQKNIKQLDEAFAEAKHADLLKNDIFAPSLALARENLKDSRRAFEKGQKDYAHWRLRELTSQCLDCHTRMPVTHSSSFQDGFKQINQRQFKSRYNLALAQMIVRQYPEAKATFTQVIEDKIMKKQFHDILTPMKQVLLIQTKVQKDPEGMLAIIKHYEGKQGFSQSDRETMSNWRERLNVWKGRGNFKELNNVAEVDKFIKEVLEPLFKKDVYVGKFDVDLLFASGILSNYSFENPESKRAPEVMFWLGLSEKYLKRENFFGSGDNFLKGCVRRYPKSQVAPRCLKEYKESVEFEFTGSRGTDIPAEIKQEITELEALLKQQ
jgi:hypothetical protein